MHQYVYNTPPSASVSKVMQSTHENRKEEEATVAERRIISGLQSFVIPGSGGQGETSTWCARRG